MIPETAAAPVLAISATFTAEPAQEALQFWIRELTWHYNLQFAPYNQVFQQLLDPSSLLASNRHGIDVVLVRFEDWGRYGSDAAPNGLDIEENAGQLISCLRSAAASFKVPIIVCICPASPAFVSDPARAELQHRLEERLIRELAGLETVHMISPGQLAALYPVPNAHDPHADELGHVPYTPLFFTALGTMLARRIHALRMSPYKVIALDCDETLWKGICGEDGPLGIEIDAPHRALQQFMAAQHDAGMLLCLATKNNQVDVFDTFRMHPDMPLRLDHFVSWRIDWESKAANLAMLAEELELGLDSFILLDDNAKECSEVEAAQPEVLALTLPPDPERIPDFLRHVWAFDHAKVTEVDRQRTALYTQQVERGRAARQVASLGEFVESLQIEVRIAPMASPDLARVAQLTQRTNQMNFTTIRRSESDLQALAGSEILTVHVSDRFGDYGLTGVAIVAAHDNALVIDTFLLSCRVLGRGVEHRLLAALGEMALERNLAAVEAPLTCTARNLPALLFLKNVGLEFQHVEADQLRFRFPASRAAKIRYKPGSGPVSKTTSETPAPAAAPRKRIPYARIAAEWSDPARLLERIRAAAAPKAARKAPYIAPRTELERRLAGIWSEALGSDGIGVHDDFFDLGGHSLLAVQLMSRVRQELGVDLSLELVYSGVFTVAELAEAIEVKEMERSGGDQYAALLAELEGLSDEEVRELLAKEGDPQCESS
jgi:FkbH-like protein